MFSLFLAYNPTIAKDLKRTSTKASLSEWEEMVKNIQTSCRTNTILQTLNIQLKMRELAFAMVVGKKSQPEWITPYEPCTLLLSTLLVYNWIKRLISKSSAGMEMVLSHPHKSGNSFNWINEMVWSQNASQISSVASCGFAEEQIVTDEFHIETV